MIIWINGPYGVGKSTLAEELQRRIEDSFLFDAEKVGNAVRDNMPQRFFRETFEEFPVWHETCYQLLKELDAMDVGCVIVPMTLIMPESETAILQKLRRDHVDIVHVMLYSNNETIRDRILLRGEEENCWCMRQIARCINAQRDYPCDIRLESVGKSPSLLADEMIDELKTRGIFR